jgi:hypothetical protein
VSIVTEYPLWFLVFCLLAGLGYAWLLYRGKNSELSKTLQRLLFVLRFAVVSLLCFFLLNPLIKSTSTFKERPVIVVAADNSASVAKNRDSVFYKTVFSAKLKSMQAALQDKYDVRFLRFAGGAEEDTALTFEGKETNISALLATVRSNFEGKNLGALILASDGLYNTGSNPLFEAGKQAFPIYTIALGDTLLRKDALIKKVTHNQTAYIGNQFPVEVQLQASDLKDRSATVTITQAGKKLGEQTVKYTSANHSALLNFLLTADKAGLQRYEVSVSVLEGEHNKGNNHAAFVVDVIDKREKVLLLAGAPHPDISALRQAIENNQSYEVEVKLAEGFSGSFKPYSLVVLHNIELKNAVTKRLQNEIQMHKTSVWQFARTDFWAFPAMHLTGISPRSNDAEPVLNPGFALFGISNELKNYLREFPAVACPLASYKVATGASVLIQQQIGQVRTDNPVLLFSEESGQKTALFCGDGLWRWRLRDYADHDNTNVFDELVQKTVQYLSVKADKSFFRVYTRRLLNENEAVEFDAEVFNPSYELITEPDVTMVITDEAKKQYTYTFSKGSGAYNLNAGNFAPGHYTYRAQVKINNQLFEQRGEFTVKQLLAEFTGLVADHSLLFALARRSGGAMYYPSQLEALQKMLLANESIKTLVHEQRQVNDLINLRYWFAVLLVFLSLEWFLRKYNGLA